MPLHKNASSAEAPVGLIQREYCAAEAPDVLVLLECRVEEVDPLPH